VIIRFGHDWDPTCMKMDETLFSIAEKVKNFAVMYLVDITKVPGESQVDNSAGHLKMAKHLNIFCFYISRGANSNLHLKYHDGYLTAKVSDGYSFIVQVCNILQEGTKNLLGASFLLLLLAVLQ